MQLLKPHIHGKVHICHVHIYICMTECILFLIQGLAEVASLLLSLSLSVPLMLGCDEVSCYNISTLTAARPGWVTPKEVSGSSQPASVSGHITSFQCITSFHIFF